MGFVFFVAFGGLRRREIDATSCTTRRIERNRRQTTRTILRVWRCRRRGAQPVHRFNNEEDNKRNDEKTNNIIEKGSIRYHRQSSQLRIRERRRILTGNINKEV